MEYAFFILALVCFAFAGIIEIVHRKSNHKRKIKKSHYIEVRSSKIADRDAVRVRENEEKEKSKFDHLFKISFKKNADEKTRHELIREAETLPDIPKVGGDDDLTSYFRIEDDETKKSNLSGESNPRNIKPEDWIFVDPKKLEQEGQEKKRKNPPEDEWNPAIFFGDES